MAAWATLALATGMRLDGTAALRPPLGSSAATGWSLALPAAASSGTPSSRGTTRQGPLVALARTGRMVRRGTGPLPTIRLVTTSVAGCTRLATASRAGWVACCRTGATGRNATETTSAVAPTPIRPVYAMPITRKLGKTVPRRPVSVFAIRAVSFSRTVVRSVVRGEGRHGYSNAAIRTVSAHTPGAPATLAYEGNMRALLVAAILCAAALTGGAPLHAQTATTGIVALGREPDRLYNPTSLSGQLVANLVFDPLVGLDDQMNPYPVLAESIPGPDNSARPAQRRRRRPQADRHHAAAPGRDLGRWRALHRPTTWSTRGS